MEHQDGNTRSRNNTAAKQLVTTWMGDHIQGLDVEAVATNTLKIPEAEKPGLHYTVHMLLGPKNILFSKKIFDLQFFHISNPSGPTM